MDVEKEDSPRNLNYDDDIASSTPELVSCTVAEQ